MGDIKVHDFKWEKGKNDLKYIELLEKNNKNMMSQLAQLSKKAGEKYHEGHKKGRIAAIDEVITKCGKEYQTFSQDTMCKIWLSTLEELKAVE